MSVEVALVAIVTAVAAGLMGSIAVMRRMSLAADPLSHIALPGIGVALALHQAPMFGAVAALLVGAFLVWVLKTRLGHRRNPSVVFRRRWRLQPDHFW